MNRFIEIFKINQDIIWSLSNKLWILIKGPLIIFFLLKYLTVNDQGLWYSFISLGALKIFAELGFTTIVSQFVSHEYVKVKEYNGVIIGDPIYLNRFFGFIKYSLQLFFKISIVAFFLMLIIGLYYYKGNSLSILIGWAFFSFFNVISLIDLQ